MIPDPNCPHEPKCDGCLVTTASDEFLQLAATVTGGPGSLGESTRLMARAELERRGVPLRDADRTVIAKEFMEAHHG